MAGHPFDILRRDLDTSIMLSHTMLSLVIALLVLVLFALLLVASLLWMRQRRRRARMSAAALPKFEDDRRLSTASTASTHRRVMVRPSESVYVYQEKPKALESGESSPTSPLPEIRITFPEETDDAGKRVSGRVVVVRVGDTSIGLEPVHDNLPAYEKENERLYSLDLERIGGLEEKNHGPPSSWQ